jgi:hypothetical protein
MAVDLAQHDRGHAAEPQLMGADEHPQLSDEIRNRHT